MSLTRCLRIAAILCVMSEHSCSSNRGLSTSTLAPTSLSVCQIRSKHSLYDESVVALTATIISDGQHLILAIDPLCDDVAVAIEFSAGVADAPGVITINRAIFAGTPGTAGKHITGRFIGKLHVRDRRRPLLEVTAVDNVQVSLAE